MISMKNKQAGSLEMSGISALFFDDFSGWKMEMRWNIEMHGFLRRVYDSVIRLAAMILWKVYPLHDKI